MKVLGITSDYHQILRCLRMDMPLLNLKKQGLIEDYVIADTSLRGISNDTVFDVVWLQRIDDYAFLARLRDELGNHYVYDIDDYLIGNPSYVTTLPDRRDVTDAVKACKVLTVTTGRLQTLLAEKTGCRLSQKTVICPNGFEYSKSVRQPGVPKGILWTSSDYVALTTSKSAVTGAVARFARDYDLPVYFFGRISPEIRDIFHKVIDFGLVSYWHHKVILAGLPSMLGVAPLETSADKDTLDFIRGKSDVKMTELSGFGHPSVYSKAPPYEDTDLKVGLLVENTERAWYDGLELTYSRLWKSSEEDRARVVNLRHMDVISAGCWIKAIEQARLDRPVQAGKLKEKRVFGSTNFSEKLLSLYRGSPFLRKVKAGSPRLLIAAARKLIKRGN